MEKFNVGDKVWLKTGGPTMIIEELYEKNCKCTWFEVGKTHNSQNFNYEVITKNIASGHNPYNVRDNKL